MVKSELVERITPFNPDVRQSDSRTAVETFFKTIMDQLATGGDIELRGFGRFFMSQHASRTVRNPRTGAVLSNEATAAVRFRTGKRLSALLNGS